MKKLIYLEDALNIAMQYCPDDDGSCSKSGVDIREMLDELEALPSAEPEIIRCKDCKHRHDVECPMYHEEDIEWDDDGYIECETIYHDWTEDDGYCDRGERENR